MKRTKQILRVLLVLLVLLAAIPISNFVGLDIFPKAQAGLAASGSCGKNVTWNFDAASGALTISGTGAMTDYSSFSPFHSNTEIKSVTISNGVTSIGDRMFIFCRGITSVTIPDSITRIGMSALYSCSSLTSVTIPDNVRSIGDYAFSYCSGLTSITIPNSLTSMGDGAFMECDKLTEFIVSKNATSYSVDDNGVLFNKDKTALVIYPCGKTSTSYVIPNSVTRICACAFRTSRALTSVTIPDSVTSIGNLAFSSCKELKNVEIPNSVITLGEYAFSGCSAMTSISIPDSVRSIGSRAFSECYNVSTVSIGTGLTKVDSIGLTAMNKLTEITVHENNTALSNDSNGVLFNKDKTTLICYPSGNPQTRYAIPNTVTKIGEGAFYNADNLITITIPDSVKSIESDAFYDCDKLTSIAIPNGVTSIATYTFADCRVLQSVVIPQSVKKIDDNAFDFCGLLEDVYYGGSDMDWHLISCGANNTFLTHARIHYNYQHEHVSGSPFLDLVRENEVAATCTTAASYTVVTNCTICGETVMRETVYEGIPLGHNYIDHRAQTPTCTEIGWDAYQTCSRCDYTTYKEKTALGHDYVAHMAQTPTCTEIGWDAYQTCSRCDYTTYKEKPANGHTKTIDSAVSATCTDPGLTEGMHCAVCTIVLTKQEIVPAHGHEFVLIEISNPTCTKDGQRLYICRYDESHTKSETIAALGHIDTDNDGICDRSDCSVQMTGSNHCKYCNQTHSGPFGWLIQFFHNILAIFKR